MSTFAALRRLVGSAWGLALTRAEFASVELSLARAQLLRWIALTLLATLLALLALLALSALVVLVLWERLGVGSVGLLVVVYAAAALLVWRRVQRELGDAPPLLAGTVAELRQDRDALWPEPADRGGEAGR